MESGNTIATSGINSLPLTEIERRAKPLQDKTTDPTWRYRCFDGFIGENEKFLDIISNDTKSLTKYGVDHTDVAKMLK
jgi:hypothetical protein